MTNPGRFWATKRLEIMTAVLGLADDRDGITLEEASAELGVPITWIEDSLDPIVDLFYDDEHGLFGDISSAIVIEDGSISLRDNWWRDLTGLSPGDVALLYSALVVAGELPGVDATVLRAIRQRLQGLAAVVVHEPVPAYAARLLEAKSKGRVISACIEMPSLATDRTLWEVHGVRLIDHRWRAAICEYPRSDELGLTTLDADVIHDVEITDITYEPSPYLEMHAEGSSTPFDVDIEHDHTEEWRLGVFDPRPLSQADDGASAVTRVTLPDERSLAILMLRLGRHGRIVGPASRRAFQATQAEQVLANYGASSR